MSHDGTIGAVIIGGEHPGLAIARSLGRRDIPVVVIDDQYSVSIFLVCESCDTGSGPENEQASVDAILEVGRRAGLKDWFFSHP